MKLLKSKISELEYEIEDTSEEEELQSLGEKIVVLSRMVLQDIKAFQESTPIFNRTFIFKNNVSLYY